MIPAELKYHTDHEWIRVEGKTAVLGITDYAQEALGDVVFLELPALGSIVKAGQEIGEVESTKTTSAIYTPVSGKIIVGSSSTEPGSNSWPRAGRSCSSRPAGWPPRRSRRARRRGRVAAGPRAGGGDTTNWSSDVLC